MSSGYEFTGDENKLLAKLASRMHFVGLFGLGTGVLVIAAAVVRDHHFAAILSGAFYALIGIWTQRASVSFRRVVETQGHDIRHLLHALEDLRKLYTLQYWICLLALLVALGLLAASVVWMVQGA
jgi:hypothetical protein